MNLYVNKKGKRVRELFFLTLLFLLILYLSGHNPIAHASSSEKHYFLKVISQENKATLLTIEVCSEEVFFYEYTNSRDLNPIVDVFQVKEDGNLCLLEERYLWFGAGQEYHKLKDIHYEDGMVVVKLNREVKVLTVRVAYTVEQKLKIKDKDYLLNNLAKSGEAIDILIEINGGQEDNG